MIKKFTPQSGQSEGDGEDIYNDGLDELGAGDVAAGYPSDSAVESSLSETADSPPEMEFGEPFVYPSPATSDGPPTEQPATPGAAPKPFSGFSQKSQKNQPNISTQPAYSSYQAGYGLDSMKKNILANDVEVKGTIKFDDELIFDGRLEGEVVSEGTLILGENSEVQGEVKTKAVSLSGRVQGNITVEEKCELKGRAQLIGDLKAARLVIEEGATFVGRSEVTPNKVNMPRQESLRAEDEAQGRAAAR